MNSCYIESMKVVIAALIFFFTSVFADEEKYTTKYDNINFDEIIQSDRLLKNYVNCLMDRGNCTADGKELKRVLPDALETDCQKCSEAQKTGIAKVIKYLVKNKRAWWNELEDKYDPQRAYREKYKEEWKIQGFSFDD